MEVYAKTLFYELQAVAELATKSKEGSFSSLLSSYLLPLLFFLLPSFFLKNKGKATLFLRV